MGYDEFTAKLQVFNIIKQDLKNALEEKGLNMEGISFKDYFKQVEKLPYLSQRKDFRVLLTDYFTKISDNQGKKLKISFYNKEISKSVFETYGKDELILETKPFFKQHIDRFLFNNIIKLETTQPIEETVFCSIKIKLFKDGVYCSVIESNKATLLLDDNLIYNKIYTFTFREKPIRVKFNFKPNENNIKEKVYLEFLDEIDLEDTYFIDEDKKNVLIDLEFFNRED